MSIVNEVNIGTGHHGPLFAAINYGLSQEYRHDLSGPAPINQSKYSLDHRLVREGDVTPGFQKLGASQVEVNVVSHEPRGDATLIIKVKGKEQTVVLPQGQAVQVYQWAIGHIQKRTY